LKYRKLKLHLFSHCRKSVVAKIGALAGERFRRQVPLPAARCNNWSGWINNHHPSGNASSEVEKLSASELDSICIGGTVTKLRCKDEKGEPFHDLINVISGDKTYVYTCQSPGEGASCTVVDAVLGKCPDFSIQFYCDCTITTHAPALATHTSSRVTGSSLAITTQGKLNTKTSEHAAFVSSPVASTPHSSTSPGLDPGNGSFFIPVVYRDVNSRFCVQRN